jgi:2,3-dihydroxybiphenyl 1,2-dioxygenase
MTVPAPVQSLGYIGVRADSLEDWSTYAGGLLGLQRVDKGGKTVAFRMDDRKQRIVVDGSGGKGIGFFGWEVADGAALDAVAARLEKAGFKVARATRALADERHVKDLIVSSDPFGNRIEIFHGPETASDAFKPGRNISGFRTGPLGLGHAVLTVENDEAIQKLLPFYRDLLGFRLTDFYNKPFGAYFMHVNPRHHSLAFIRTGKNAVHHIMMELYSFDDVGQGYDIANMEDGRVATTLGRHTSDFITSFYTWTPSAFMIEYGWGARDIDVDTWQSFERTEGPSLWGHERAWLPEAERNAAREKRMQLARDGVRQPVQVIEGNFEVNAGICPWLDAMARGQKRA